MQYITAWRHIRQIFADEGVTNVVWVWNVSGVLNPLTYYPGDAYVDWIGFDKYDDGNAPFLDAYQQAYGWLAPFNKPILVGETGAQAASQPTFFAAAVSTLQSQFPLIKGYIYFDAAPYTNWVITGPGMDAFKTMATDPYFAGMPGR